MVFDTVENLIQRIGVVIGLVTLAIALWQGVWRGLQRPPGRTIGIAGKVLQAPFLLMAGLVWIGICLVLWRPIPLMLSTSQRVIFLVTGAFLYFLGLILYLWGARTLGAMYKPSSAFGVQLNAGHRLITYGPFALVRHPLYLGLQVAAIGGFLLFKNWTFVFITLNFLGLFFRARREEEALAAEFGKEWEMYAGHVPLWLPRFRRKAK